MIHANQIFILQDANEPHDPRLFISNIDMDIFQTYAEWQAQMNPRFKDSLGLSSFCSFLRETGTADELEMDSMIEIDFKTNLVNEIWS